MVISLRRLLVVLVCIFFLVFSIIILFNSWKHSYITVDSSSALEETSFVLDYSDLYSGAIVTLPWENDPGFLEAVKSNNVFLLMAAYRTVLLDPLPGEEYNVHLAARLLSGTVLAPNQIFSHNDTLGPYTEHKGFKIGPTYIGSRMTTTVGGGVCKIASTLYNVAILSDLEIMERHPHSMPVPYVPYGQDATVAYGIKDFKFRNTSSAPLLIWAQGIDNCLYIAFYGQVKPPKVEWHHEVLRLVKKHSIYHNNNALPLGYEEMVMKGMNGGIIKSWVSVKKADGSSETKILGQYYYSPIPDVINIGTSQNF